MEREELEDKIFDDRRMYVLHYNTIPNYIAVNEKTKSKIVGLKVLETIEILIDESLKDDEFRLLRK